MLIMLTHCNCLLTAFSFKTLTMKHLQHFNKSNGVQNVFQRAVSCGLACWLIANAIYLVCCEGMLTTSNKQLNDSNRVLTC